MNSDSVKDAQETTGDNTCPFKQHKHTECQPFPQICAAREREVRCPHSTSETFDNEIEEELGDRCDLKLEAWTYHLRFK